MHSPQTEPAPCRLSAAVLYSLSLYLPAAVQAEVDHVRPQCIKSKLNAVTVCGTQLWLLCLLCAHHIRGVSTVRGPNLQGEELALRLDLLRVSGRSDRGCAMPAQAWDLHLSPWATSLERFRSISPTCLLGP